MDEKQNKIFLKDFIEYINENKVYKKELLEEFSKLKMKRNPYQPEYCRGSRCPLFNHYIGLRNNLCYSPCGVISNYKQITELNFEIFNKKANCFEYFRTVFSLVNSYKKLSLE